MLNPQLPSVCVCRGTALQQPMPASYPALQGMYLDFPAGIKGGSYSFDIVKGPDEIFARFFGTLNPYEALQGECGCLQQQAVAIAFGARQLSSTAAAWQGSAPLHDSCLSMHHEVPKNALCHGA